MRFYTGFSIRQIKVLGFRIFKALRQESSEERYEYRYTAVYNYFTDDDLEISVIDIPVYIFLLLRISVLSNAVSPYLCLVS